MKRLTALFLSLAIAATSLSGCYGKFALTRKIYAINGEVKDRYLRSAVTWAFVIIPVYGVSALLDFIVFNTIEFWSGNNPIAQGEKEFFYADGGELYRIKARKSGEEVSYRIERFSGKELIDTMDIAWNLENGDSTAVLNSGDRTTAYHASRSDGGVRVERYGDGAGNQTAALYGR